MRVVDVASLADSDVDVVADAERAERKLTNLPILSLPKSVHCRVCVLYVWRNVYAKEGALQTAASRIVRSNILC